ncbi:helix-turn-helix domain-containing protein [Frisingicoccus sp.]|uniref:helix-turn-helix transcriptional regulator n=1 Tax=Frisingicoccus sp. TaxID=1918627 RepID=UPI0015BE5F09
MRELKISIAAARVNSKLNQREFAEKIGVSLATVTNWEKGKTEPDASQLREISRLSGIPMDYIFIPKES